jgi:predicted N-acetyltransferase YhbS
MTYPDFTFTLTPATPSDIPILAQISQLAFATDTHTRLKAVTKGSGHVLPAYQGMGVGSALIRWGTRIANEEGVYCRVHSSDKG